MPWRASTAWAAAGLALRLAAPSAALAVTPEPATPAAATTPAPTATPAALDGIVANASGDAVDAAALNADFEARIGAPRGLRGLVLLRGACGADPEALLDSALIQYGAAQRAGEMYNDTVAWLLCREPPYAAFTFAVDNPLAAYLDPPSVAAAMTAALAEGGSGAAAAAGLAAAADQLARAPAAIDARPTAAPPPPPPPTPPADDPPMAAALLWLVVGLLALGGVRWAARRRRAAAPPPPAEPDAVRELDAQLDLLRQRLVDDSPSLDRLLHALEPLGDGTRLDLLRRHQAMVRRAEALAREAEVVGHLRAVGDLPERGDEALLRLEAQLVEARALAVYTRQIEREAARAARLHLQADELQAEAEAAVDSARTAYGAIRPASPDGGRRLPPAETAFAVPAAWLATAAERAAAGDRLDAGRRADDAIDLAERVLRLARRLRRTEAAVDEARQRFAALAAHSPAAWSDVVGDGAEAEASLDAAAAALDGALSLPLAALGVDPPAGLAAGLVVVGHELARARQLVAAIDARRRHLEAAASAVVEHGAAVAAALAAAAQTHPAAGAARDALAGAADAAARSTAAADATPPDWAAALDELAVAAHLVASLLPDEPTDGAPPLADRALSLAQLAARGAVDRAERYLAAHRRDASTAAARRVAAAAARQRQAERERERRPAASDLAASYLATARAAAAAFAALEADVRKAERRRVGWLPRATGAIAASALSGVRRSHPFAGRLGPWEAPRPAGGPRPGAWGALPPGTAPRPTGW